MFKQIKHIPADRKNSLPVTDLQVRYRRAGVPVVIGDLTKNWPAASKWNADYLCKMLGGAEVPVYSERTKLNHGNRFKPVLETTLDRYFEMASQADNDFRVHRFLVSNAPQLEKDFSYPRLGFNFFPRLTALHIGSSGVVEPMRRSSAITHSVHCHFGEPASVLLVPEQQSLLLYAIGNSKATVRDIDFNRPDFKKYPALKAVKAYVAELQHGDALYIPAGFWHCTYYHGTGVTLSLQSLSGKLSQYLAAFTDQIRNRFTRDVGTAAIDATGLTKAEQKVIAGTNKRVAKVLKKAQS